jgi:putative endonuclease
MAISVRERRSKVNALQHNRARLGRVGERLALAIYMLWGYTPMPRPRTEHTQTDLLLRRGETLVLVEVKTRRRAEPYAKVLSPAQKARLAKQVAFWVARCPHMGVRLDVVQITLQWPFVTCWQNVLMR